jgi:hypothetical protein
MVLCIKLFLAASFSEDLGGVINLVDKYGYDIDEGIIPREIYVQCREKHVLL